MRGLLSSALLALILNLLASSALARTRVLDTTTIRKDEYLVEIVRTVCVDGYKFLYVIADVFEGGGVGLVQVYEEKDGKSVPARCGD